MQDALHRKGMGDAVIDRRQVVGHSVEDAQNAGRGQGNAKHLRRIDGQLAMGHPQTDAQLRQMRSQSGTGLDRRTMERLGMMNDTLAMRTECLAVFSMRHHSECRGNILHIAVVHGIQVRQITVATIGTDLWGRNGFLHVEM